VAIVGRTGLAESADLAGAVADFAAGLPEATVLPVSRRPNLYGAVDMGVAPDLGPGRVPVEAGLDADAIVDGLGSKVKALVLLGADPIGDHPAAPTGSADFTVSIDMFLNDSNRAADVVLPAAGFSEVEGTMTNLEGRVQKVNRLVPPPGQARPATEILADLASRLGDAWDGSSPQAVAAGFADLVPYADVTWDALDWGGGRDGIVARGGEATFTAPKAKAEKADGLALHLARVLYDGGTAVTMGPSLAKLAPEAAAYLNPKDAAGLGLDDGDSVTLSGSAGEATLSVRFDGSLAPGTVYVPFNLGVSIGSGLSVKVAGS
jgi:predicted molibdopterin-dependent oxidoreductase YjgC